MTNVQKLAAIGAFAAIAAATGCDDADLMGLDSDGCDKVDILFVIDNSGSMGDNQANLIRNFPKFAESIEAKLGPDVDYHVGVVTTDAYANNPPSCQMLGGLVSQTIGEDGSPKECIVAGSGARYLTSKDNVSDQFSCIANVGTFGSASEDPIGAARAALGELGTGSCNDGFLRGDSLLVLAFLTDEDALPYENAPPDRFTTEWVQGLAEASGHHPENTVVVSMTTGVAGSVCENELEATMLVEFTNKYTHHHLVDICAESYGEPLRDALEPVDKACANYEPRLVVEQEAECTEDEPPRKAWILMAAATIIGTVATAVVFFITLAPALAGRGHRQTRANAAACSGGMTLGGIAGVLVAWSFGCGPWGWFGIIPAIIAAIGALLFVICIATGRK